MHSFQSYIPTRMVWVPRFVLPRAPPKNTSRQSRGVLSFIRHQCRGGHMLHVSMSFAHAKCVPIIIRIRVVITMMMTTIIVIMVLIMIANLPFVPLVACGKAARVFRPGEWESISGEWECQTGERWGRRRPFPPPPPPHPSPFLFCEGLATVSASLRSTRSSPSQCLHLRLRIVSFCLLQHWPPFRPRLARPGHRLHSFSTSTSSSFPFSLVKQWRPFGPRFARPG